MVDTAQAIAGDHGIEDGIGLGHHRLHPRRVEWRLEFIPRGNREHRLEVFDRLRLDLEAQKIHPGQHGVRSGIDQFAVELDLLGIDDRPFKLLLCPLVITEIVVLQDERLGLSDLRCSGALVLSVTGRRPK